ncbi:MULTISPECIES: glycosyltransferase [unclassified Micromonospora]|uniref:glycosyltransferase n=1 Tax=unclassified Micromonospora TaxID=2617518 RepID=UPI0036AE97AF|nr:glycosyltransferase [Micromonospora sp. NBC_00858]
MTSIVIAAHNERAVIGRCLDALLAEAAPGEFEVTVVANGCTDETAAIAAARPGVRVVELAEAGKPAALNAGDDATRGFPRIYLDADIVLSTQGVRAVAAALDGPHLAATVRRELDLTGRPTLVRAYFSVHHRLPVFRDGLFGRGVIGLSEAGRHRFDRFPALVADDLFLDSLFGAAEKRQVDTVSSRVATPRRTGDLVRRLSRVRRGNSAMRAAAGQGQVGARVHPAARLSWLRDVVLPRPWLAPAALCYVAITVLAALSARSHAEGAAGWGRDDSSRQEEAHARVRR